MRKEFEYNTCHFLGLIPASGKLYLSVVRAGSQSVGVSHSVHRSAVGKNTKDISKTLEHGAGC